MTATEDQRYYIDHRVGCIAVIDRTLADPENNPGLHEDTPGVLWYKHGVLRDNLPCPTCGYSVGTHWEVPQEYVAYAEVLCHEFNASCQIPA